MENVQLMFGRNARVNFGQAMISRRNTTRRSREILLEPHRLSDFVLKLQRSVTFSLNRKKVLAQRTIINNAVYVSVNFPWNWTQIKALIKFSNKNDVEICEFKGLSLKLEIYVYDHTPNPNWKDIERKEKRFC